MADLDAPLQVEETPSSNEFDDLEKAANGVTSVPPSQTQVGDFLPLAKYYGVENMTQQEQEKLATIWKHFSKTAETKEEIFKALNKEHRSMVQPNIGETRLQQMYNYVRILQDINESDAMLQAYKK